MNEKIAAYVESLFANTPPKRRFMEIKEELISNLTAKYNDLLAQGKSQEESYTAAVSGIGDLDGLLSDMEAVDRKEFVKSAGGWKSKVFVYGNGKKKYVREDDSFVEAYREKVTQSDRASRLSAAMSSMLWLMVVMAYFLISFYTYRWDITWLIFLVGAVLQQVISSVTEGKLNLGGMLWTTTVIAYFCLSFWSERWELTWLVFLLAAALQHMFRLIRIWREKE